MPTDAQRRATAKYKRENIKTKTISFNRSEFGLLDWIREQPNQNAYLKDLVRADMARRAGKDAK